MRQQSRTSSARLGLDSQALATFGAASVDHSAATFGFHAHEKAVGAGAASFGRLISTFHDLRVQLVLHQAEPMIIADFTPCAPELSELQASFLNQVKRLATVLRAVSQANATDIVIRLGEHTLLL
jgi:hypothetical protein